MTRFARAKGSKASNEKAPEDGTPWEVMKEQLLRAKQETEETIKREEAEKQRIENYENFLREQKISKRKATWCEFPETENFKKDLSKLDAAPTKKIKKNKETLNETQKLESIQNDDMNSKVVIKDVSKKKNKKNKQKSNKINQVVSNTEKNEAIVPEPSGKKNKKENDQASVSNEPTECISQSEMKKNKKRNKNVKTTSIDNIDRPNDKVKEHYQETNEPVQKTNKDKTAKLNKKNKKKHINGEPIRRKVIDDRSFQLIISGKEVELIRFEGFPIMKKDADRLQELKNNMIKKGIPKSEVQRTIKLERRRAEKALARLKRDVCYNCRKGGHNLSDCPELKSKIPGVDGANDGMCFKCGSTEHRQFECKVQRDKEFRFATCFICKDQGHIARQCPDNPKGLYPNGGCCKLCGDVTHLKKDCPTTKDQKQDSSVKLQILDDGNIEDIVQKQNTVVPEETARKPKKIKF